MTANVHVKAKANYCRENCILCAEGRICEVLAEEPNGALRVRFGREAVSIPASDVAQYFEVIPGSYTSVYDGNAVFTLAAEKCAEFFVRRKLVQVTVSELAPQIREALVRHYLDYMGFHSEKPLNFRDWVFTYNPCSWIRPVFEKYGLTYKEMTVEGDTLMLTLGPDSCVLAEETHYRVRAPSTPYRLTDEEVEQSNPVVETLVIDENSRRVCTAKLVSVPPSQLRLCAGFVLHNPDEASDQFPEQREATEKALEEARECLLGSKTFDGMAPRNRSWNALNERNKFFHALCEWYQTAQIFYLHHYYRAARLNAQRVVFDFDIVIEGKPGRYKREMRER